MIVICLHPCFLSMATSTSYDEYLAYARQMNRYSVAASVAILYYDYILTLLPEYRLFWLDRRITWTSFLYFLNRYTALMAHVPVVIEFFGDLSDGTCYHMQFFHQIYCAIATLIVTILLAIRTYALYDRSYLLLLFLVFYIVGGFAIACWQVISGRSIPGLPTGRVKICGLPLTEDQGKNDAVAWSPTMIFDCIVFGLTLYKRLKVGRTVHNSLLTLMLRDGTMYFGFLCVFYLLELINFLVWGDIVQMATFTNVIASTLISRLMLNIRDPKNRGLLPSSTSPSTTLRFTPSVSSNG